MQATFTFQATCANNSADKEDDKGEKRANEKGASPRSLEVVMSTASQLQDSKTKTKVQVERKSIAGLVGRGGVG